MGGWQNSGRREPRFVWKTGVGGNSRCPSEARVSQWTLGGWGLGASRQRAESGCAGKAAPSAGRGSAEPGRGGSCLLRVRGPGGYLAAGMRAARVACGQSGWVRAVVFILASAERPAGTRPGRAEGGAGGGDRSLLGRSRRCPSRGRATVRTAVGARGPARTRLLAGVATAAARRWDLPAARSEPARAGRRL